MKNLYAFIVVVFVLAGVSAANAQSKGGAAAVRVAVVEFTPTGNAISMTAEAKRQLQASIAFEMVETQNFEVVDVRNTRRATSAGLESINGDASTAAAVKAGKGLKVKYILTGTVTEYTPKDNAGYGQAAIKVRLIDVATGKVKYSGASSVRSGSAMRSSGASEMQSKVLKPMTEQLADTLSENIVGRSR